MAENRNLQLNQQARTPIEITEHSNFAATPTVGIMKDPIDKIKFQATAISVHDTDQ